MQSSSYGSYQQKRRDAALLRQKAARQERQSLARKLLQLHERLDEVRLAFFLFTPFTCCSCGFIIGCMQSHAWLATGYNNTASTTFACQVVTRRCDLRYVHLTYLFSVSAG